MVYITQTQHPSLGGPRLFYYTDDAHDARITVSCAQNIKSSLKTAAISSMASVAEKTVPVLFSSDLN